MIRTSPKRLEKMYKSGELKKLARELPHAKKLMGENAFVRFLMKSNLLKARHWLDEKPITLGADPEFILVDREGNVHLFSSKHTDNYFGISEAEIGADYGLLEFRIPPEDSPEELVGRVARFHERFENRWGPGLQIHETEAIRFNHRRKRILETMEEEEAISFGPQHRGKDTGSWASRKAILSGTETGISLSAYNKPTFNQFNPELFTAGGHIHIGGTYINMLSFRQLKSFIRKIDQRVFPLSKEVETKAGELRREVYGAPGEFRIKEYGVEYRSMSNAIFWKKNLGVLHRILDIIIGTLKNMAFEKP